MRKPLTYTQAYPYRDGEGILHMMYQETYTFPCAVQAIGDVRVTSTVTGTATPDPVLLALRDDGRTIYADGCGTATLTLADGSIRRVQVDPAPLNLLLVTGQSNASADASFWSGSSNPIEREYAEKYHPTYADYYLRTRPGKAYFTWSGQGLSIIPEKGKLPSEYVPTTLDWETTTAAAGAHPRQFSIPRGETQFPSAGWSAALANQWVAETGECVWIVNASHGGKEIAYFIPNEDGTHADNEYYQAVEVFGLALETLYREIDAGHFTLHHFAYYWYHGGGDSFRDEDYYYRQFVKVHSAMMRDVVFEHGGVRRELEYCGLFCNRSKFDEQGNGRAELYLNGPRLAQYYAAAERTGVFANVYFMTNVTERWTGSDRDVEDYFLETYGSREKFAEIFGYPMPTTRFETHPTCHYLMQGHNEMGMDCARNNLRLLNLLNPQDAYRLSYPDTGYTVHLLSQDGHSEIRGAIGFDETNVTVVYPAVTPIYYSALGVELRVETAGFEVLPLFKLRRTDPTKKQLTLSVLVGGEVYATYDLAVREVSYFHTHLPYFDQPGFDDEGYWHCNFYGMHAPWSLGYTALAEGTFTPYHMFSNGWLTAETKGYQKAPGGFLAKLWYAGVAPSETLAPTVCYTVERDGVIGVGVNRFSVGVNRLSPTPANGIYLAVLHNGRMVWPIPDGRVAGDKRDWFFAPAEGGEPPLNALLSDLTLRVKAGDTVSFCLGRDQAIEVIAHAQPTIFPTIIYRD